jgi:hypothetical protein
VTDTFWFLGEAARVRPTTGGTFGDPGSKGSWWWTPGPMGELSNPSIQLSSRWVRFFTHPNLKGLVAWFWVRFKRPIKSKGLSGFVLGSFGFVPGVKSLIVNNLVAPFDHFGHFFAADPVYCARSLSLGDTFRKALLADCNSNTAFTSCQAKYSENLSYNLPAFHLRVTFMSRTDPSPTAIPALNRQAGAS